MTNLRELAEEDLAVSLEGDFGLPVILKGPNGFTISTKKGTTDPLMGQILYDIVRMNPETGEDMEVNEPVITLRRSSLERIPKPGENWFVEIPIEPKVDGEKKSFIISGSRTSDGGGSLGIIRLFLRKVEQK